MRFGNFPLPWPLVREWPPRGPVEKYHVVYFIKFMHIKLCIFEIWLIFVMYLKQIKQSNCVQCITALLLLLLCNVLNSC